MSSPEHKEKIWNLIKDVKVGMLATEDQGDMHARPMHMVQKDYDGTIWFFTRRDAEKVDELKSGRNVCLTFSDPSNDIYVSMTGKAHLSFDKDLIDKFWNPFVGAWFENGKQDPNVALLEIKISSGEHWKTDSNKIVQLYEIAKANVTSTTPDMGENEKFGNLK